MSKLLKTSFLAVLVVRLVVLDFALVVLALVVFVALAAAQKNRKKKLGRDRFPLDGEDLKFEERSNSDSK